MPAGGRRSSSPRRWTCSTGSGRTPRRPDPDPRRRDRDRHARAGRRRAMAERHGRRHRRLDRDGRRGRGGTGSAPRTRWRAAASRSRSLPPTTCHSSDATFDAAMSSFVLQLVPNRHRALREIRRTLRPGAPLAIVTWLRDTTIWRADEIVDELLDEFGIDPPPDDDDDDDGARRRPCGRRATRPRSRRSSASCAEPVSVRSTARPATLEIGFDADGYIGFLTEFDDPTLFDSLEPADRDRALATLRERLDALDPGRPDDAGTDRLRDRPPLRLSGAPTFGAMPGGAGVRWRLALLAHRTAERALAPVLGRRLRRHRRAIAILGCDARQSYPGRNAERRATRISCRRSLRCRSSRRTRRPRRLPRPRQPRQPRRHRRRSAPPRRAAPGPWR